MSTTATRLSRGKMGITTLSIDLLWVLSLLATVCFLLIPKSFELFVHLSKTHVYYMAFIKFAFLATMGELLATRIISGYWRKPAGLLLRAVIWGLLGMLIALVFYLYGAGVAAAQAGGILLSIGSDGLAAQWIYAALTSILMNLLFAPTFMAFHRISDTWIDMGGGKLQLMIKLRLSDVLEQIDWNGFISFVVCKTIPLFWIPAHTFTFMLPQEHRVLAAAFLSIALGAILASARKMSPHPQPEH